MLFGMDGEGRKQHKNEQLSIRKAFKLVITALASVHASTRLAWSSCVASIDYYILLAKSSASHCREMILKVPTTVDRYVLCINSCDTVRSQAQLLILLQGVLISRGSSRSFKPGPGPYVGHGTLFEAMGTPYGGCGVPLSKAVDDNGTALPFVALNTNSMFEKGVECGRWVEITLMENCVDAGNKQWEPCAGGGALHLAHYQFR